MNKKSDLLKKLTMSALMLPGLTLAGDLTDSDVQYGHYEESHRNLGDIKSKLAPISVDGLVAGTKISLTDRVKVAFKYVQDTWSGATPITTAPTVRMGNYSPTTSGASPMLETGQGSNVYFDKNLNPLKTALDVNSGEVVSLGADKRLAHTMSLASPETRREGSANIGYELGDVSLRAGGGLSSERDYESRFGNIGGRWDFNQKLTSLDMGLSYANSDTSAKQLVDTAIYIDYSGYKLKNTSDTPGGVLTGNRQDWATTLGLTHITTTDAALKVGVGYSRNTGYLANPYKAVTVFFVEPTNGQTGEYTSTIPLVGQASAFLERRPNEHNEISLSTGYVQNISQIGATARLDYLFSHDDWGVDSHTFETDWIQTIGAGWSITPRARYYTHTAADFYTPYLVSMQPKSAIKTDADGNLLFDDNGVPIVVRYDAGKLPQNYSSDQRLSGYGVISGGLLLTKQFSPGIALDVGADYNDHRGGLLLGGGGEGSYADFSYYTVNASIKIKL